MLGLFQKLLYLLTLGPFEKSVKGSRIPDLNFDSSFGELITYPIDGQQLDTIQPGNLDRVKYKRHTNLYVSHPKVGHHHGENWTQRSAPRQYYWHTNAWTESKYDRQNRIIRFGLWSYFLFAASVCLFFDGVAGMEDSILYIRRVEVMMIIAAAVDVVKLLFDIRSDPLMKFVVDLLILVLGVGATSQIVLSIPQFYYEISKLF